MPAVINKPVYGPRHNGRAQRELAELMAAAGPQRSRGIGGGYTVTFTHEQAALRVFVWANNRSHALLRALELKDVAQWLPLHPGSAAGVMGMGLQPADTPEGVIRTSLLATH